MKGLFFFALAAFTLLEGCTAMPTNRAANLDQADAAYLYGTWAGEPQRPSLMD